LLALHLRRGLNEQRICDSYIITNLESDEPVMLKDNSEMFAIWLNFVTFDVIFARALELFL